MVIETLGLLLYLGSMAVIAWVIRRRWLSRCERVFASARRALLSTIADAPRDGRPVMLIGRLCAAPDDAAAKQGARGGVALLEDASGTALVTFDRCLGGLVCDGCLAERRYWPAQLRGGGIHAVVGIVERERPSGHPFRDAWPGRLIVRATEPAHPLVSIRPEALEKSFDHVKRREERIKQAQRRREEKLLQRLLREERPARPRAAEKPREEHAEFLWWWIFL